MSDDTAKLATVLYELVGELGVRNLLPRDYVSEWLSKLHPMCSKYDCGGCGKPIRFTDSMVGSDLFSFYAHKHCEKLAQKKWKEAHHTPPVPELKATDHGGSDG